MAVNQDTGLLVKVYGLCFNYCLMHIETILLILESVLLLVTIILILLNIKEGRERSSLIRQVGQASKTLTRLEYFLSANDAISDARKEVAGFITGRKPTGSDINRVSSFTRAIARAKSKGVGVRYILPRFQDRLYVGYLYSHEGAEVRYYNSSTSQTMRYMVVDEERVVIAVPESISEREMTSKGYVIPSSALASILKANFEKCWNESIPFKDYVQETLEQTGTTIGELALEIGVESRSLKRVLSA
jgi:hypothetical protein